MITDIGTVSKLLFATTAAQDVSYMHISNVTHAYRSVAVRGFLWTLPRLLPSNLRFMTCRRLLNWVDIYFTYRILSLDSELHLIVSNLAVSSVYYHLDKETRAFAQDPS